MRWLMLNLRDPRQPVYEPLPGRGTTLIGAHRFGVWVTLASKRRFQSKATSEPDLFDLPRKAVLREKT